MYSRLTAGSEPQFGRVRGATRKIEADRRRRHELSLPFVSALFVDPEHRVCRPSENKTDKPYELVNTLSPTKQE